MTTMDEDRLRLMGVDTKVGNFLLYDNNWVQFFEWMLDNTTDENIYTDQEMSELLGLREGGLLLSSCEVEEQLLDLNQQFPGILVYTKVDLEFTENKLKNLCRLELFYRDHYRQSVTLLDRLEEEVNLLQEELAEKEMKERRTLQTCMEQAIYLEERRERRKTSFQEMQRFVNEKTPTVPIFMYQMPLQNFNDTISLFLKHVDIFVTKNFSSGEDSPSVNSSSSSADRIQTRIDDLKFKWAQVEDQYLSTKLDVVGRANIVEKFLKKTVDAMAEPRLEQHVKELRCRNATMDAEFDALLFENQTLLKKAIQSECDLMLHKRFESKKARAMQQHDLLTFIQRVVGNVLTQTELIWVLMKIDQEKLTEHMKAIQSIVAGDFETVSDHVRHLFFPPFSSELRFIWRSLIRLFKFFQSALAVVSKRNVKLPVEQFEKDVLELQKRYLSDHFFMSRNIFEITEEIHFNVGQSYANIRTAKFLQNFFFEYSTL